MLNKPIYACLQGLHTVLTESFLLSVSFRVWEVLLGLNAYLFDPSKQRCQSVIAKH